MEKMLTFCFVANVLPAVAPMFSRSFDIFRDIKVIVLPLDSTRGAKALHQLPTHRLGAEHIQQLKPQHDTIPPCSRYGLMLLVYQNDITEAS